jgi:hypothetical protein
MRSNGKGIIVDDIYSMSASLIGKFRFDIRVTLKDKTEIKLRRRVGLKLWKLYDKFHSKGGKDE